MFGDKIRLNLQVGRQAMKFFLFHTTLFLLLFCWQSQSIFAQQELAKPSAKQIRFADWEVGAFFHYNLNPFTGKEHDDGQSSPTDFNPSELDVEQWIRTAKSMGARYAVLTARHEGGFCLWPSATTEYSIANSPWKGGKGDLVREFVDACRKHDLAVGLYHTAGFNAYEALKDYKGKIDSPLNWTTTWGKTVSAAFNADPGLRERFNKIQVAQMRELLTQYGPIDFMWSDHWNAMDENGVWRAVTDLANELQPELVFMGPDTWVPGNETGHVVYPMWNPVNTVDGTRYSRPAAEKEDQTVGNNYGLLEGDVRAGHPLGKFWRVRECTTAQGFHYGGWFWHPDDVKKTWPKKLGDHVDLYYRTVGLGANTIINLPPDTRGLVPDDIAAAAARFGEEIRKRFSTPIASLDSVTESNVVELKWEQVQPINTVVTMENIADGQRVVRYSLEAFVDGKWQKLEHANRLNAWPPYNSFPGFQTIGHKKIDRVVPVETNRMRFRCEETVLGTAQIRSMQVFHCDPIPREFDAPASYLSGVDSFFESAHHGVKRDVDYRGGTIELGGERYEYGLMVCPVKSERKGVMEFELDDQKPALGMSAVVGIEDATGKKGSCVFIVEGLVDGKWKELFKSKRMTGRDKGTPVKVMFPAEMSRLRLVATDGGDGSSSDHAVWADAQWIEN